MSLACFSICRAKKDTKGEIAAKDLSEVGAIVCPTHKMYLLSAPSVRRIRIALLPVAKAPSRFHGVQVDYTLISAPRNERLVRYALATHNRRLFDCCGGGKFCGICFILLRLVVLLIA